MSSSPPNPPPRPEIDPARAAESNTAWIVAVVTIFHALALTFVSLRVYARAVVIRAFGKDDVFMVLSALCALGGWSVFIIQAHHGLGKHQETISAEDMVVYQHAGFWQSIISANCALGFLKISIGFNLLRLSNSKWYNCCLWITIVFVVCYTFMGMMTFFLHCKPMAGHWDKSLNPECYSIKLFITFSLINTSFNITTDVLFATFPIPIIWSLQLKRKLRMYLIGILSLGYFAVAMGIVKAVYQIAFATEPDKTFRQSITFWGFLQLNIGIVAACATSLKPLVNRILNLSTDAYQSGSKYGGYGTHSRGMRRTMRESRAVNFQGTINEYELDDGSGGRVDDRNLSNGKGETVSTAVSFYKHASADGSGSEEMILGAPPMQPRTVPSDDSGRTTGILMTTEVRVSVK